VIVVFPSVMAKGRSKKDNTLQTYVGNEIVLADLFKLSLRSAYEGGAVCNVDALVGEILFRSLTLGSSSDLLSLSLCVSLSVCVSLVLQEAILDHSFSHFGLDESRVNHPVLLTEPLCNPNYSRKRESTPASSSCLLLPHPSSFFFSVIGAGG